ncbi:MAG: hypothetical protein KAH25_11465 [Bacteroidales bacterium]|nr:hypothetical protein [Bacteroidales bacterium]
MNYSLRRKKNAIGLILTGANKDGSYGLKLIQYNGGKTVVQEPRDAEHPK